MLKDSRIFVAGHRGLAGSALVRALAASGYANLVTRTHAELDLTDQAAVRGFFQAERVVVFAVDDRCVDDAGSLPSRDEVCRQDLPLLPVRGLHFFYLIERLVFDPDELAPFPLLNEHFSREPFFRGDEMFAVFFKKTSLLSFWIAWSGRGGSVGLSGAETRGCVPGSSGTLRRRRQAGEGDLPVAPV